MTPEIMEARSAIEALRSGVPSRNAAAQLGTTQIEVKERFEESMDALAGPLNNMFNFQNSTPNNISLYLDPGTGAVTNVSATTAVANPKNQTTIYKQVQLDGSASTAANGGPLTYSWQLQQGGGSAALTNANTATPNVQFGSGGIYTFQLMVTDTAGVSATDTVTLTSVGR